MNIDQPKLRAYEKHLDKAIKTLIDESATLVSHEEQLKRGGEIAALVGQTVLIDKLLKGEFGS